jgi:purine-binding chemotaxis protein CheW
MSKAQTSELEQQLVVFDVGDESFGVDIDSVQEIIRMQVITRVPGAPEFVEGIINLRGRIIPVIDLRRRIGLARAAVSKSSRIVVVEIDGPTVGMIVDGVSEVLRLSEESVEPPSSVVSSDDSDYIKGIAKLDDRLITLLQLDRLLVDRSMAGSV